MTPRATAHAPVRTQCGFTLLEIMVVMGMLFVFMMFLTNILLDVTEVFSQSRKSQEITQRMVEEAGGEVRVLPFVEGYSTTGILNRSKGA